MTARILIMVTVWLVAMPGRPVCAAADTLQCGGTMTSLECSFVRKQWFQGQCRISQGRFYYDGSSGSACYDYSGSFHYRFIVTDTAIVGIDKKNNRGYMLFRSSDPQQYEELYFSVHLFDQFLRSAAATGDGTVRGSVDSCVYFEKKTGSGSDMIATARETGLPCLVESFDENGAMVEQSRMLYDNRKNRPVMPLRVIVKKKWGDIVTADTLTVSAAKINTNVMPEQFTVSQTCRLYSFHEMQDGLFPFTAKRK